VVRDDVMEFAGDPQAFGEHRTAAQLLALRPQQLRLLGQPRPLPGTPPRHLPDEKGPAEVDHVDQCGDQQSRGDRTDRPEGAAGVLTEGAPDLVDTAADREVPRQPGEHEDQDRADDDQRVPTAAGPGHPGEDRHEVDDLHRELSHHGGHGDADDEHVRRGEHGHGERAPTSADEDHRTEHDSQPLHPGRLPNVLEGACTAGQLEGHRGERQRCQADHQVTPVEATLPLPRVVDREEPADPLIQGRHGHHSTLRTAKEQLILLAPSPVTCSPGAGPRLMSLSWIVVVATTWRNCRITIVGGVGVGVVGAT
jgi:hypothetical protein